MSQYKDLRTLTGGLDYDSDPRNILPDDYMDAMCLVSGTSKIGGVRNSKGNTLINHTLPTGNNTCIGSLRNIKENSIIYFVYNDLGNHSILEFYCETRTIEVIFAPDAALGFTTNFLGFTLENKIHSANIIDDILTWTDNNVSPRKINKKSAKAFMNSTPPSADVFPYSSLIATGTEAQKLQFIEFIKYKPPFQPVSELRFDSSRKTNYLQEKMVQVIYRYIYDDDEYSRWSDGSYVSLPYGTENINGTFANSVANNYLRAIFNTGHPTVKAIDLAFRFGNTGTWAKLDTPVRKYDNDNNEVIASDILWSYDFYNDTVLIEIPDQIDNYDSVPQLSKTQDIVDNNIQIFANNVEGYENPDISVLTEYVNTQVDMGESLVTLQNSAGIFEEITYWDVGPDPIGVLVISNNRPSYIVEGSVISFVLNRTDCATFNGCGAYNLEFTITYGITAEDLDNWPTTLAGKLVLAIQNTAYPAGGAGFIYSGAYTIVLTGDQGTGEYTRIYDAVVIPPTTKQASLKKGAFHTYGIVYKDAQGRDGGVVTNQSMVLYNPYLPEILPGTAVDNQYAYVSNAKFTINHQPPIWAKTYEVVYALSNIQKYTQFLLKGSIYTILNGNYELDCSYIIDYITKERIITSVDFQFEPGDYLRFVSNDDFYCETYVNAKVLAFDTTTNKLTVSPYSWFQVTAGMATPTQQGTLCELYRIKPELDTSNRPFFAIGETYDVLNPGTVNRYHAGNTQDQTALQPAVVSLIHGDCYIYRRYFNANTMAAMVESENFSDIYQSKNIDISMVYTVIPEGKTRRYEQGLRYGGRYFPNTNTNNLCTFNGSDYDTVNTRFGPINKIVSIGYTLKVLQTKKNTSIYIDRNMIFNPNGDNQLTLTDRVLGNKNPSELDYGCEHPESVCVDDRQIYFFDVNTGTFIQDSANGMFPISAYKMVTYFRNIADAIKNTSGVYVYASVDNYNKYVNVSFVDTNATPAIEDQTIAYHVGDNRWKSNMPYIPDYFGSNALTFISFKNGALWEHNTNPIHNNFYGVQYSMKVKVVSNIDYPKVKVFDNIAVYTNSTFESPNTGDISIPAGLNYPNGMESRLIAAKFRSKEGVSYASYLRDQNTPNSVSANDALLSGRKLRGEVLIQQLENSDTDEVVLYSVIIHSTPSELSK